MPSALCLHGVEAEEAWLLGDPSGRGGGAAAGLRGAGAPRANVLETGETMKFSHWGRKEMG